MKVSVHEFISSRPSVVGILEGEKDGPTLMLSGHLDTVPIGDRSSWSVDPFDGEIIDGKIYGRGATNMKGGVAAMISPSHAVIKSVLNLRGKLLLTFVADEEGRGMGIQNLLHKGYRFDFAVIGELTELKVRTAHRGVANIKIVSKGKVYYVSTPQKGHNAIYDMSRVCLVLEELLNKLVDRKHTLLGTPKINAGTNSGRVKSNIVPNYCEIMVDRRMIPGEVVESVLKEIERLASALRTTKRSFSG
ncbi:MAG: M20/M25/M40 family metallo-hydrolase [Candidatus Micrarchaeaceae archaeon]